MQVVRTIVWVLLLVALVLFSAANWEPTVTVRIWQDLVVDTKIPAIVVVSFAIGFVPMWLVNRAARWQFRRRIQSLENAARAAAAAPVTAAPVTADPVAAASPPDAPASEHTGGSSPEPQDVPAQQPDPEAR